MILFHSEGINFEPKEKRKLKNWIKSIAQVNNKKIGDVNYIFKTDEGLHKVNLEYLSHDTYTDIITFDNSETENIIDSDIYISVDRVKANATELNNEFEEELRRVIIHGILHLCGFKDKTSSDAALMRRKEDEALEKYES
ncbi:rRNA maturation RNase YbeY [Spirosomataceae bacterium TFI 002]|nr:rRNA maturation RNase YbeY [Spirosomataceae bacterium TFI 002]